MLGLDRLKSEFDLKIPAPETVLFGHTHDPISESESEENQNLDIDGKKVVFYNTGGWLNKEENDSEKFVGARVFKYETGKGLSSVLIE